MELNSVILKSEREKQVMKKTQMVGLGLLTLALVGCGKISPLTAADSCSIFNGSFQVSGGTISLSIAPTHTQGGPIVGLFMLANAYTLDADQTSFDVVIPSGSVSCTYQMKPTQGTLTIQNFLSCNQADCSVCPSAGAGLVWNDSVTCTEMTVIDQQTGQTQVYQ